MGNEDALISKLIEETCIESVEKNENNSCIDLRKYYEKKINQIEFISINDYLDQHHLCHQQLVLESFTGCYRLSFKETILDFPSNWSIFKSIHDSDFVYIDQSLDHDFLLDIFSEISGSYQNIALLNENQEVQLIFLPDEESNEHVEWMKNYFEKKRISSFKEVKAA